MSTNSTGYGPWSRWDNLQFNGDENKWEQWEFKFLAYMRLVGTDAPEADKNGEAYAELIQFLDDRSLGLVMREIADKG